jgi:hypothetical protein
MLGPSDSKSFCPLERFEIQVFKALQMAKSIKK